MESNLVKDIVIHIFGWLIKAKHNSFTMTIPFPYGIVHNVIFENYISTFCLYSVLLNKFLVIEVILRMFFGRTNDSG